MSEETKTLTIHTLKRLGNTKNGNPQYSVLFRGGISAKTQPDAQVAYVIENQEYKDVPLVVSFDKEGTISAVRVAG